MTTKTTATRPSQILGIEDEWIAYQLDSAVVLFGTVIEGAAHEMEEIGSGEHKRLEQKYTMRQLLDPDFRLPREAETTEEDAVKALKRLQGKGVRVWKADS